MSEPTQQNPQEQETNLGFSTRTDALEGPGSQADTNTEERSTVPPVQVATGDPVPVATNPDAEGIAGHKPGEPLGKDAPALSELVDQMCPNCKTGVLQVTRYDPDALHEADQGAALLKGHESGGAYEVRCGSCDFTDSRAFNPGKLWGR